MFSTYLEVAQALRKKTNIAWVDLDQGQIQAIIEQDDSYSIDIPALPCAFVGIPDEDWNAQLSGRSQIGTGQLVVTTLLQLPSTTHANDPLVGMSVEALELADQVHEAVLSVPDVEHRIKTRRFPVRHLFAVQHIYEVKLSYIRPTKTTPKPDPLITATIAIPINYSN